MKKSHSSRVSNERYQSILKAAERLFGEKGYQGVSIEEIARTAGVSKGLVIYHFGSKEDLLVQVLRQGTAVLFSQLDMAIQDHKTAKDKIRAAVEMYLTIASAGPALTRMAMIAVFEAAYSESIRKLWLAFMEENLNKFAELIEEGISNGELKPVDSRLVTQLVMAMAFEVIRLAALKQEPFHPHEVADEVTNILFDGISQ